MANERVKRLERLKEGGSEGRAGKLRIDRRPLRPLRKKGDDDDDDDENKDCREPERGLREDGRTRKPVRRSALYDGTNVLRRRKASQQSRGTRLK